MHGDDQRRPQLLHFRQHVGIGDVNHRLGSDRYAADAQIDTSERSIRMAAALEDGSRSVKSLDFLGGDLRQPLLTLTPAPLTFFWAHFLIEAETGTIDETL